MNLNKKLIDFSYYILLILLINCISIPLKLEKDTYPISFSELPYPSKNTFEVVETYWYWFGIPLGNQKSIDEILTAQKNKIKDSKGIKNLILKKYNKTWYSYSYLPNPFAFPILSILA